MINIAILVSGNGSNMQAVIDACIDNTINAKVSVIISDRENAFAIERGKKADIPTYFIKNNVPLLLKLLADCNIQLIILAGYLSILDEQIISNYKNKIINVHPSLIPKYCGKGFYGDKIHKAVIAAKEKFTGVTVHFVDVGIDTGPIILQEQIEVFPEDTASSLQKRVLEVEHKLLVEVVKNISYGGKNEGIN